MITENQVMATINARLKAGVALVQNRVARGIAREGEKLPLIEFHLVGSNNQRNHSGEKEFTMLFNCDGVTSDQCSQVAEQARVAFRRMENTSVEWSGGFYDAGTVVSRQGVLFVAHVSNDNIDPLDNYGPNETWTRLNDQALCVECYEVGDTSEEVMQSASPTNQGAVNYFRNSFTYNFSFIPISNNI